MCSAMKSFYTCFFVELAVVLCAGFFTGGVFESHDSREVVTEAATTNTETDTAASLVVEVGGLEEGRHRNVTMVRGAAAEDV